MSEVTAASNDSAASGSASATVEVALLPRAYEATASDMRGAGPNLVCAVPTVVKPTAR